MVKISKRQVALLVRRFFTALGISAVPIGILAPLAPDWWEGKWWLVLIVALLAASWAVWGFRRREPLQKYVENVTIRLVVGDLFKQDASAVVGFTTTFDTCVPDVISPTSVQAGLLNSIYGGSQEQLDHDLNVVLATVAPTGEIIEKPGKTILYPISTVVTIAPPGPVRYYCAAYTRMDAQNRATGTIRSVLDALDNSWDQADAHGNGAPICVPLIGQGQSRVPELVPEIAIRLIAFSFLLRTKRSRFASELRIVLHPNDRHKISFPEFQAFLTSLAS
jgi:hypothetical protein